MNFALIIDRDSSTIEVLKTILEEEFVILTASDYSEIMEIIKREITDFVILNVKTPQLDIEKLILSIKKASSGTIIIVYNDTNECATICDTLHWGAYDYFAVPLNKEMVKAVINRAIANQKQKAEMELLRTQLLSCKQPAVNQTGNIEWIEKLFSQFSSKGKHYYQDTLKRFSRTITSIHNHGNLLNLIVDTTVEIFGVQKSSLLLLDENTKTYRIKASVGIPENYISNLRFRSEEGIINHMTQYGQIIQRNKLDGINTALAPEIIKEMKLLYAQISFPLSASGKLIGVLNLSNKVTGDGFSTEELELLSTLGNYAAVAIANALLYEQNSREKSYNKKILNNITSGVITVDQEGTITTYNKSAEKILNIKASEAIGENIQKIGSKLADIAYRTLRNNETFYRFEIVEPSSKATLGVSTSTLKDNDKNIQGVIIVFADLSTLKELESQLKRADRLAFWNGLAIRLAHEIKNPLVSIKTFAQLLPEKYSDAEFREKFYSTVTGEATRLDNLTEKLIDFAHSKDLIFLPVKINKIIDEALNAAIKNGTKDLKAKIKITKDYDETSPEIPVDYRELKQALVNILLNSIEAMAGGGHLKIRTVFCPANKMRRSTNGKGVQDRILIEIVDSGTGIDQKYMDKLFEPLFTTKDYKSGFGLAITNRIIEDHGGSVEVKSKPGKGTIVNVYLPLQQRKELYHAS